MGYGMGNIGSIYRVKRGVGGSFTMGGNGSGRKREPHWMDKWSRREPVELPREVAAQLYSNLGEIMETLARCKTMEDNDCGRRTDLEEGE